MNGLEFKDRTVPTWYQEAGFGIFIHWGPYSVPAWAPTGKVWKEMRENPAALAKVTPEGWVEIMAQCPYADWYWNTMAIEGSPTSRHHAETYGDAGYEIFGPMFADALQGPDATWDPDEWVDLFVRIGAKYVVLNARDADGYTLYPSAYPNPHMKDWQLERDVVGELAAACRKRGLKFGTFFTAGLDWTFVPPPVVHPLAYTDLMPDDAVFHEFIVNRVKEMIDRYQPDILWDDMGWPPSLPVDEVFRYYYERVPDGVVNDRFNQAAVNAGEWHADVTTPEYTPTPALPDKKWEVCRGIGWSFGYNAVEPKEWHLTTEEVLALRADVNARGGNLLLNMGPTADGRIPPLQREVLEGVAKATGS